MLEIFGKVRVQMSSCLTTIEANESFEVFRFDVKNDVNINNKATFERLLSTFFIINPRKHITATIICLHSHNVLKKLSSEQARIF